MTQILVQSSGYMQRFDSDTYTVEEQTRLTDNGGVGPYIHLTMNDHETKPLQVWMGLDATQPVNTFARLMIDRLTGLHIMCFGPVLLASHDADALKEASRG